MGPPIQHLVSAPGLGLELHSPIAQVMLIILLIIVAMPTIAIASPKQLPLGATPTV